MVLFGDADFRPSTTAPLTFKDFGEYFLIPHLICMLIAEDMNILIADSWEILKKSSGAGSVLMSLTAQDDLLDEVFEDNIRRRRKRTADGTTIDHGAPNVSTFLLVPFLRSYERIFLGQAGSSSEQERR